jgi:hypothetical protein
MNRIQITNSDLFGQSIPNLVSKNEKICPNLATLPKLEKDQISATEVASITTKVKFKNNNLTQFNVYNRADNAPLNPNRTNNLLFQNNNKTAYNGFLSPNTRKNITEILSVWLTSIELNSKLSERKLLVNPNIVFPTFVTLTLPATQKHSDLEIKEKVLKPFLKWLTQRGDKIYKNGKYSGQQKGFGVNVYFWRAEPQMNGNIHFHLIIDRFIPWERIRNQWNLCCEYLGYVTDYSNNMKDYYKNGFKIKKAYLKNDIEHFRNSLSEFKKTGIMPKNIHPVYEKHIKLLVKYGKDITPEFERKVAEAKQKHTYDENLKCGFNNPNSTDIHAIQHLDSVTAYVIKYVCKKPKEAPLKKNQEVKYNETLNKECLYTYEKKTNIHTGEIELIELDMQVYVPVFEERKIEGKIWGSSDSLKGFIPKKIDEIETDHAGRTFLIIKNEAGEITKMPIAIMKNFSRIVSETLVIMTTSKGKSNIHISPDEIIDHLTQNFIKDISKVIGEEEINRVSACVGENFLKMKGKIIPLNSDKLQSVNKSTGKVTKATTAQLLQKYSPELFQLYKLYFEHIYNCLYNPQFLKR